MSKEKEIVALIEEMRGALEGEAGVEYGSFWEARRRCLPFFRESIHPAIRARLWSDFHELTDQVRRLKGMRDQDSNFSLEQFEKAIVAIKEESTSEVALARQPIAEVRVRGFDKHREEYLQAQRELALFTALGRRVVALRKELLQTDLRTSDRNRLLRTLSNVGDGIFPRRKAVALGVREKFLADVESYLQRQFGERELRGSLAKLRSEIRDLQAAANRLECRDLRPKFNEAWERIVAAEVEWREEQRQGHEQRAADAAEAEKNHQAQEKILARIEEARQLLDSEDPELLERDYAEFCEEIGGAEVAQPLCEQIEDRLLDLRQAAGEDLLAKRLEQRTQVKAALDLWKRRANSSGLDLHQALEASQRFEEQKARLAAVEKAILQLEG